MLRFSINAHRLSSFRSIIYATLCALIIIIHGALLLSSALSDSQTVDEVAHLGAGASYIAANDFRINPEHPPLIKLLAGATSLKLGARVPFEHASWALRDQWNFGRQFLYHNVVPFETLLTAGRVPSILISLFLVFLTFMAARALAGAVAGLIAASLIAFDPNIIAHGHLITNDLAVAAAILFSVWSYRRFQDRPTMLRIILAGAALGVALITKFTAVFLIILLPILALSRRKRKFRRESDTHNDDPEPFESRLRARAASTALVMGILAFLIIWLSYGFEVKIPTTDPTVQALASRQSELESSPEELADQRPLARALVRAFDTRTPYGHLLWTLADKVPVPAFSFFKGLSTVNKHNYYGHTSYFRGAYSEMGSPWYFPLSFIIKTPTVWLILYANALLLSLFLRIRVPFFLLVTPSLFFAIAMTSHINLGLRHILPVYPFLALITGLVASRALERVQKYKRLVTAGALAIILTLTLGTALRAHPFEIGYFNDFIGGWKNGHRYLLDSNIDWGQDLFRLAEYQETHNVPNVALAYFGSAEIEPYGIRAHRVRTDKEVQVQGVPHDVIVISLYVLYSENSEYQWLISRTPTDTIGTSLRVYDLRNSSE